MAAGWNSKIKCVTSEISPRFVEKVNRCKLSCPNLKTHRGCGNVFGEQIILTRYKFVLETYFTISEIYFHGKKINLAKIKHSVIRSSVANNSLVLQSHCVMASQLESTAKCNTNFNGAKIITKHDCLGISKNASCLKQGCHS